MEWRTLIYTHTYISQFLLYLISVNHVAYFSQPSYYVGLGLKQWDPWHIRAFSLKRLQGWLFISHYRAQRSYSTLEKRTRFPTFLAMLWLFFFFFFLWGGVILGTLQYSYYFTKFASVLVRVGQRQIFEELNITSCLELYISLSRSEIWLSRIFIMLYNRRHGGCDGGSEIVA